MRVWLLSRNGLPPGWKKDCSAGSAAGRVAPTANYDPQIGHQLLNRYLDEFALCDEGRSRHHGQRAPQHLDLA